MAVLHSNFLEDSTCQRKPFRLSLHLQHLCGFFISFLLLLSSHLTFSQREFLHSSQGPSCLHVLRHRSLLSGLGGRSGGVMRRQGTCYGNLGGKSSNIFGKMPLYTLSHPLFFFRFLHLAVGIFQSSLCVNT